MQKLLITTFTLLFSVCAVASNNNAGGVMADGFIKLYYNNYRVGVDHVYEYCDKAMYKGPGCYDVTFDTFDAENIQKQEGKWRTADDYIKYKTNDSFAYSGMSTNENGITLYYRKVK